MQEAMKHAEAWMLNRVDNDGVAWCAPAASTKRQEPNTREDPNPKLQREAVKRSHCVWFALVRGLPRSKASDPVVTPYYAILRLIMLRRSWAHKSGGGRGGCSTLESVCAVSSVFQTVFGSAIFEEKCEKVRFRRFWAVFIGAGKSEWQAVWLTSARVGSDIGGETMCRCTGVSAMEELFSASVGKVMQGYCRIIARPLQGYASVRKDMQAYARVFEIIFTSDGGQESSVTFWTKKHTFPPNRA